MKASNKSDGWLERRFQLQEHGVTVKSEFAGGTVIFFTMAYILAVNPNILSAAGMDSTAVMLATCLASALGSFLMGVLANLPFGLSAGMGLNAYFAYTVVITMGYPWENALFAVFVEGIIFIILSQLGVRERIFNAIPKNIKVMVSVAIGCFICFIGMQNVHIVIGNPSTLVGMASFRENFSSAGICLLLFVIGIILIGVMLACKVPGAMLIGIIVAWILGILCEAAGIYIPDPEAGYYSMYPHFAMTDFSVLGKTVFRCFGAIPVLFQDGKSFAQFVVVVLSFLFVDLFDTLGTLTGGAVAGDLLDADGQLPKAREALTSDAIATSAGALLGTSTITSFVESIAGIMAGAKTGLAAVVVAFWFLVSTFASSFFTSIPSFATASALVVVGAMMLPNVMKLEIDGADDYCEWIPALLCLIGMVVFYSISEGIGWGLISYVALNAICNGINKLTGKTVAKSHQVTFVAVCIAIAYFAKYYFL